MARGDSNPFATAGQARTAPRSMAGWSAVKI
jgi:hypothetical protein